MEEKAICIVSFASDQGKWCKWKLKFLSKALYCGYQDMLLGKTTVPKDSETLDLTTDAAKELDAARSANWMAYAALALACEEGGLGIVKKLHFTNLLDGDAAVAWKNLTAKYKPTTNMLHMQL